MAGDTESPSKKLIRAKELLGEGLSAYKAGKPDQGKRLLGEAERVAHALQTEREAAYDRPAGYLSDEYRARAADLREAISLLQQAWESKVPAKPAQPTEDPLKEKADHLSGRVEKVSTLYLTGEQERARRIMEKVLAEVSEFARSNPAYADAKALMEEATKVSLNMQAYGASKLEAKVEQKEGDMDSLEKRLGRASSTFVQGNYDAGIKIVGDILQAALAVTQTHPSNGKAKEIADRAKAIGEAMRTYKDTLTEMEGYKKSAQPLIATAVADKEKRLQEAQRKISGLEGIAEGLQTDHSRLKKDYNQLEAEKKKIEAELRKAYAERDKLLKDGEAASDLAVARSRIEGLEAQVKSYEIEITTLKESADASRARAERAEAKAAQALEQLGSARNAGISLEHLAEAAERHPDAFEKAARGHGYIRTTPSELAQAAREKGLEVLSATEAARLRTSADDAEKQGSSFAAELKRLEELNTNLNAQVSSKERESADRQSAITDAKMKIMELERALEAERKATEAFKDFDAVARDKGYVPHSEVEEFRATVTAEKDSAVSALRDELETRALAIKAARDEAKAREDEAKRLAEELERSQKEFQGLQEKLHAAREAVKRARNEVNKSVLQLNDVEKGLSDRPAGDEEIPLRSKLD